MKEKEKRKKEVNGGRKEGRKEEGGRKQLRKERRLAGVKGFYLEGKAEGRKEGRKVGK